MSHTAAALRAQSEFCTSSCRQVMLAEGRQVIRAIHDEKLTIVATWLPQPRAIIAIQLVLACTQIITMP